MKQLLLALLIFCLSPVSSYAQFEEEPKDERITLQKVVVTKGTKDTAKIFLVFDTDFKQPTSHLHDRGLLQVILPKTKFAPNLKEKRVNNNFIKEIRLKSEGKHSILEIQFADSNFNPEGKTEDKANFEELVISISKQALPPPIEEPVAKQTEGKLFSPETKLEGNSTTESIVEMLLALALILAFLYAMLLFYQKVILKKFNLTKGKYEIKLTSSFHVGQKQRIAIVEVNELAFAIGISSQNINLIGSVSGEKFSNIVRQISQNPQENIDFAQLRDDYLQEQVEEKSQEMPTTDNFAQEFIQKIKGMKPIE